MGQPKVLEKHQVYPFEKLKTVLLPAIKSGNLNDPEERAALLRMVTNLFEMAEEQQRSYLELKELYLKSALNVCHTADVTKQLSCQLAPTAH